MNVSGSTSTTRDTFSNPILMCPIHVVEMKPHKWHVLFIWVMDLLVVKLCFIQVICTWIITYQGGKTKYHVKEPDTKEVRVNPIAGSVLVFPQNGHQNPRHEGAPHMTDGQYKYIIRSDIVFVRRNKLSDDGSALNVLKVGKKENTVASPPPASSSLSSTMFKISFACLLLAALLYLVK